MNLHEHLTDTLDRIDETGPDLARMTSVARRRGTGIKRRRSAGVVVLASVAVLALGGGVLALDSGADGGGSPIASEAVSPDIGGRTLPTTAQGAVLALQWAVGEQRAGSVSDLAGQLGSTSGDHYVELSWHDADGLGVSVVGLNVQHARGMHATCDDPEQLSCSSSVLPDGSELTTYEARGESGEWRRYADLFRPDDRIRVVASSANGVEGPGAAPWQVTRPAPPLSAADLSSIVRQPMWGDTLPEAFVEAGAGLDGYEDIDDPRGWIHGDAD